MASKIREVFASWDKDNSGTITRVELAEVLMQLMNRPRSDCDLLMDEIDVNGDGVIEWEEFIQWVMNPNATMKTAACGTKLQEFDFNKVLKPLFECYDRSGNEEFISVEDFQAAHSIVQGALKLYPVDAGLKMDESMAVDVDELFESADGDGDDTISFGEFVSWQKRAMEKSGIPNFALHDVITHLVTALRQIFHIDEKDSHGKATEADQAKLLECIEALVTSSKQLWSKTELGLEEEDAKSYPNHWCEPPVGLSVERLVKKNLKEHPIRTFHLKETHADVRMCVPHIPSVAGDQPRKWYAKVLRTTRYENSAEPRKDIYYYEYVGLNWSALRDPQPFYHAVETLAPDVRLFCLLKAEANMGIEIGWRGIMAALEDGIVMELITQKSLDTYRAYTLNKAVTHLRAEGSAVDLQEMDQCVYDAAERLLEKQFKIRPRHVMASLARLDIVAMSPVWQEFWDDQREGDACF